MALRSSGSASAQCPLSAKLTARSPSEPEALAAFAGVCASPTVARTHKHRKERAQKRNEDREAKPMRRLYAEIIAQKTCDPEFNAADFQRLRQQNKRQAL